MTVSNFNTPNVIQQFLSPLILQTPTRDMIAGMMAQELVLPYNHGNQILVTRFQQLPPAVTAVPYGSPGPTPLTLKRDVITVALSLYAVGIFFDTRLIMSDELPWLASGASRIAVSIREGQDINFYAAITASASQYKCKYGVNGDNPTEVTLNDFLEVYSALKTASAPMVTEIIPGDLQFNTVPVQECFFALMNPVIAPSLYTMQGFIPTANYPIKESERSPSEFGSVQAFRFWQSSNVPISPNASALGNQVVSTIIGGAKPYGGAYLDGNSMTTLYRPPEFSNAYGLQVSLSCSLFFGAEVLQNTWIVNMLSTGTATSVF
jgi:N4-gp56 family major capsid protein